MCDCISKLEKKLTSTLHKKQKVIKAEFISVALIFDQQFTGIKSTSEIELTLEGKKKLVIQKIVHSFCPFCGKSYEPIMETKTAKK